MSINKPIIILDNHFHGENTYIYKGWVINPSLVSGNDFIDLSDAERVLSILNKFDVSDDKWQEVVDAIESGKGTAVEGKDYSNELRCIGYIYCRDIDKYDKYMRQLVLDAKDPEIAYCYCRWVNKNDMQMRQVIIDAKDEKWAYRYCKDVSDDADMRQELTKEQETS